ncbi:uncharacterized protein LOC119689318 [Teleopsis dalmanni]|uniref:uncharacterized protein LOC119689318 n=1 Tax=Teleopsis dalmanni TaxID=139649 RepID=UPI0018CD3752|nr:uncharacterized protein LOC119689318 [Teleopsis dalmanni]
MPRIPSTLEMLKNALNALYEVYEGSTVENIQQKMEELNHISLTTRRCSLLRKHILQFLSDDVIVCVSGEGFEERYRLKIFNYFLGSPNNIMENVNDLNIIFEENEIFLEETLRLSSQRLTKRRYTMHDQTDLPSEEPLWKISRRSSAQTNDVAVQTEPIMQETPNMIDFADLECNFLNTFNEVAGVSEVELSNISGLSQLCDFSDMEVNNNEVPDVANVTDVQCIAAPMSRGTQCSPPISESKKKSRRKSI